MQATEYEEGFLSLIINSKTIEVVLDLRISLGKDLKPISSPTPKKFGAKLRYMLLGLATQMGPDSLKKTKEARLI